MQLLPLAALRAEAVSAGLAAHGSDHEGRAQAFLRQGLVLTEIARRTGEIETLGRAASAVLRALAEPDRRLTAEALVAHAAILSLGSRQFGDAEASAAARECLNRVSILGLDAVEQARLSGRSAALLALATPNLEPADHDTVVRALTAAASALDAIARRGRIDPTEAHDLRCVGAEVLISLGRRHKDRSRLDAALAQVELVIGRVDAAYRPVTWARAETLRGQALTALGDLTGETGVLTEAVEVLTSVVNEMPIDHSPLDAAHATHALGLSLQTLGEATDDDALFERALCALTTALQTVDAAPLLPFRSVVAHDSAACLARRAERRGDLASLERAEGAFRTALKVGRAASDPLSWAVTQLALARIYEAEAEIRGDHGERADAAFALASALDVFAERGLRSLSDMALTALERIKATA